MQKLNVKFFSIIVLINFKLIGLEALIFGESTTATLSLISDYGYPSETHKVTTADGYIVTMYRIPYSPKNKTNTKQPKLPAIFIMHGITESSSDWVLSGYPRSLAFFLSDAGYDVWLGNARGTRYSKEHTYLDTSDSAYWDFSWHEFGMYDLPACVDYILKNTSTSKLQYIGHSQGATAFFVATSSIPSFNDKIQSAYLMAPVVFLTHANLFGIIGNVGASILGQPNPLSYGTHESLPNTRIGQIATQLLCNQFSLLKGVCMIISYLLYGWGSEFTNSSALEIFYQTVPAGLSRKQILHYSQLYGTEKFCQFDYGAVENLRIYQQISPPDYELKNIKVPLFIYHSENDVFAGPADVQRLIDTLPKNILKKTYKMPFKSWNHGDFILANNVDELLYSMMLDDIKAASKL